MDRILKTFSYIIRYFFVACALLWTVGTRAQTEVGDSVVTLTEDEMAVISDSTMIGTLMGDTIQMVKTPRDWSKWRPSAKRALWMAAVIPGAGQIYNRKYWKLPIIYGGFVGCIYAWRWNNMMYHDYSQAYMDLMDDDPNTKSYESFLHLGNVINTDNADELKNWQNKFKKRKDYYRRYRDMSIFILIGVYALSVIDAYVDASLSEFDISDDITLRVEPAIMNNRSSVNPLKSSALGLQCSISF